MSSKAHGFKRKDLDSSCEEQKLVSMKELGISGKENERLKPCCDHGRDHQSTAKKLDSSPPLMAAYELDEAATRVQKVYKSYRTRRNLADCAVVAEELWWKALDSAALNRSSVSFFNTNEQESAASRWDRATRRVAKVGKGLLKDEKAQKLALHHWLEAIDPRHRYGRNLRFYYDEWFVRKSYQPFFYWLDIGDGKELNLPSCPRVDLQRQCIQYLGPKERGAYEVIVERGKLVFKKNGMLLNTDEGSKWIFVLSTSRSLYIGPKKKGQFQHSSFLSGGVTTSAGRLVARDGILEAIWPYSGHYLPTEDNFTEFITFLEKNNIDLTDVKRCSNDDDDLSCMKVIDDKYRLDITTTKLTATIMIEDDIEPLGPIIAALDDKISIDASSINATRLYLTRTMSNKWASGVGPRIGCLRDYPTELRSQALEKVNLPPMLNPLSSYLKCDSPIPAPRPVPKVRVSPRLACMIIPIPSVSPSAWIAS